MTLPTHLVTGLVIGKITGNYSAAVITSIAFDLDHLFFYYTRDLIFRPFRVLKKALEEKVFIKGRRGVFHSVFTGAMISMLFLMIDFSLGVTVAVAYLAHLVLDALDSVKFYPFYPIKTLNLQGPIVYSSFTEAFFLVIMTAVYFLIFNL